MVLEAVTVSNNAITSEQKQFYANSGVQNQENTVIKLFALSLKNE